MGSTSLLYLVFAMAEEQACSCEGKCDISSIPKRPDGSPDRPPDIDWCMQCTNAFIGDGRGKTHTRCNTHPRLCVCSEKSSDGCMIQ